MNCEAMRALLPLYAYGDLDDAQRNEAAMHLRDCGACRGELAALEEMKRLLSTTPTPTVDIDAGQMLAESATRQSRRWRRLALVSTAMAACLLLVVCTHWEVRMERGELVISWASRAEIPSPPTPLPQSRQRGDELLAKVQQLDELTRALAAELADRDGRRVGDIDNLRTRVDTIQRTSTERWQELRRDFDALYTAQFKPLAKGDLP